MPPTSRCEVCDGVGGLPFFTKSGYTLHHCPECGLLFVHPQPSTEVTRTIYSERAGYKVHAICATDGRDRHLASARRHAALLDAMWSDGLQRGRLVDVGCAEGQFLEEARRQGWQAYGVDIAAHLVRVAREERGLDVFLGELAAADLSPGSVDVVTMWDVLEHVRHPLALLRRAHELLRPGGLLFIETPNSEGLFPRLSLLAEPLFHYWAHPEPPVHLFQFSMKNVTLLVERAGFEIRKRISGRIPLRYTFGGRRDKPPASVRPLYYALFLPVAALGPLLRAGDAVILVARRAGQMEGT